MLRFKQYLAEAKRISKIFHTSSSPVSRVSGDPMWFTIREKDGRAYYEAMKKEGENAFLYQARFTGDRIVDLTKNSAKKKLSQEVEDELGDTLSSRFWDNYIDDLTANPSASDVSYMEGSEILSELGYQGVLYWDYDPLDSNKDLEAFLILNPSNRVSGLKEIKVK